ncbi:unnamed protein product, partial [Oppiella nova]
MIITLIIRRENILLFGNTEYGRERLPFNELESQAVGVDIRMGIDGWHYRKLSRPADATHAQPYVQEMIEVSTDESQSYHPVIPTTSGHTHETNEPTIIETTSSSTRLSNSCPVLSTMNGQDVPIKPQMRLK